MLTLKFLECLNCNFEKKIEMEGASSNINLADYYFQFLRNLSVESKLDLISKLSQSLKRISENEHTSLESLFGAYKSDETAEEIIDSLRASRHFNRNIETL